MRQKNFVKKGQLYKSRDNGIVMRVLNKADGSRWRCVRLTKGKNAVHKVHEGTLIKYHMLLEV